MASGVSANPGGFGAYFVRVDPDHAWLSEVSCQITDAIHGELPELDAVGQRRARARSRAHADAAAGG